MSDLAAGILLATVTTLVSALFNGVVVGSIMLFFDYRTKQRLAQFQTSLETKALEHQTRFTKLHEMRVPILAKLYKQLAQLCRNLFSLVDGTALGEAFAPLIQEAERENSQLWSFFDDNQLYLDPQLRDKLQRLRTQVQSVFSDLQDASCYAPNEEDRLVDTLNEACAKLMGGIEVTLQDIESDFCSILGVGTRPK